MIFRQRAKAMLFPSEERVLLGCRSVPLLRRLAYGFRCREGMRTEEMASLRWRSVDLERGMVHLDTSTKTKPTIREVGRSVWTWCAH